jgi:hypothetical protein
MNLEKQWPDDIEDVCPKCGRKFNASVNISVGPCQSGRSVRKIHSRMLAVPLIGFPILLLKVLSDVGGGSLVGPAQKDLIFITLLILITPPAITGLLMLTSKVVRIVRCNICGYTKDYTI